MDLPLRDGRPDELARGARILQRAAERRSRAVESVSIAVTWARGSKVGMIHEVKHFDSKLHIEVFGDPLDAVVLEDGKVQAGYAWSNHIVTP